MSIPISNSEDNLWDFFPTFQTLLNLKRFNMKSIRASFLKFDISWNHQYGAFLTRLYYCTERDRDKWVIMFWGFLCIRRGSWRGGNSSSADGVRILLLNCRRKEGSKAKFVCVFLSICTVTRQQQQQQLSSSSSTLFFPFH